MKTKAKKTMRKPDGFPKHPKEGNAEVTIYRQLKSNIDRRARSAHPATLPDAPGNDISLPGGFANGLPQPFRAIRPDTEL